MQPIIETIKKSRKLQQLTQAELGEKLGLPQSHISKIEQGKTDPRLSTIADMARLLDQELIVVPKIMLPMIKALIYGEQEQEPRWQLDSDE